MARTAYRAVVERGRRRGEHRFGRLTVLVNNAGVQNPPAPIETTEASTWRRVLDIDLTGAFFGIKAVTPALRRAGGGSITNIGSVMGPGTAHYAPYVAAKWALRGLTRTAALELGRDGIRVNVVHPGVIATPFITEPVAGAAAPIADFYSPDPFAVPRLGEPADISALVLFLASPAASFRDGLGVRERRRPAARPGPPVRPWNTTKAQGPPDLGLRVVGGDRI
ncbi:SDR family NAD(P)-dependent oxidoreductase [Pseudonocardia sp. UM4_GMWB1]|uniref:SDR family NAD(P)-dependent oxidoreductase n=1 Tax=Pseudonocardia sp. UM4_GMWB1 TaxID=2212989 RepID=UPI00307EDB40